MNDTQQALVLIKQSAFDRGFKARSEQYMPKQASQIWGRLAEAAKTYPASPSPQQKGVTGPTFLDPNDKSGPAWNADGTRKGPAPTGPSRVSHPQGDPRQMRMYDPNQAQQQTGPFRPNDPPVLGSQGEVVSRQAGSSAGNPPPGFQQRLDAANTQSFQGAQQPGQQGSAGTMPGWMRYAPLQAAKMFR